MNKRRALALFLLLAVTVLILPISEDFEAHQAAAEIRQMQILSAEIYAQARILFLGRNDNEGIGDDETESLDVLFQELMEYALAQTVAERVVPLPPQVEVLWDPPARVLHVEREMIDARINSVLAHLAYPEYFSDQALAAVARSLVITPVSNSEEGFELRYALAEEVIRRLGEHYVPSVPLVDAFLHMWDFWGARSTEEGEYLYPVAELLVLHFTAIRQALYAHSFPHTGEGETGWFSPAYLAAILQKMSLIDCGMLTYAERNAFALTADFHMRLLIDDADFVMGPPLWIQGNTIFMEAHMYHMYGYMRYRQYNGRVKMPASNRQMQASIALFELPRAAADDPNIYYASGFWVYSDIYDIERRLAAIQDVVRFALVGSWLNVSSGFWRDPTFTLIRVYQDENGILLRPGEKPYENQVELNAWLLYAYANYLR
jgi:hypothetical protein